MRGKHWCLIVVAIALAVAAVQYGRGVELRKERDRLTAEKGERLRAPNAGLRSGRTAKAESSGAFSAILAQAEELRAFSRGNNERWAAIGARIYDLPPSEFPAMLKSLVEGELFANRGYVIQALFEHWCAYDLDVALTEAEKLEQAFKPLALRGILSRLDERDPKRAEAIVLAEKAGFDGMSWLRDKFLRTRAIQDPKAAIAFVRENFDEELRANALFTVGSIWTKRDPAAAYAWSLQLSDPGERKEMLSMVLRVWGRQDPETAWKSARMMESGRLKEEALGSILGAWAMRDEEKALGHFFESVPESERTWRMIDRFASHLGAMPIERMVEVAEKLEPKQREAFLSSAANGNMDHDRRALAIAEHLPEGDRRDRVFARVARNWAEYDRAGAEAWLQDLPSSTARDEAIASFVVPVSARAPREAIDWALQIEGEERRRKSLRYLANRWLHNDRTAASGWVKDTEWLSEEDKAALLR